MDRRQPSNTLGDVQRAGHSLFAVCRYGNCRYSKEIDVPRLVQSIGPHHYLLPDRGEMHFTDKMRCPSCKRRGVNLWLRPAEPRKEVISSAPAKQPNYEIKDWGREYPYATFTTIGTADNLFVARGAYIAAAGFYADRRITLQQGSFVMADTKRDGIPAVMTHEDFKNLRAAESGSLTLEELEALAPQAAAKAS